MNTYRPLTRRWALIAVLVAALAGVAFAMDVPFDPVAWGSTPTLALVALTGFVAWLRTTPIGSRIDGSIIVPAVTLAIGAAAGAALQIANFLTYEPYASWAAPLGGVAYGALIAASAVIGVSLFNYGSGKLSRSGGTLVQSAVQFLIKLLIDYFGERPPAQAWAAISSLLVEWAASDAVLTDELRGRLQAQFLEALRNAGLAGRDLKE